MTPEQVAEAQALIEDAQQANALLGPFIPLLASIVPGGAPTAQLTVQIVNAGLAALSTAINNGQDVTDVQLAAVKAGEQASITDDLQAEKDAWDAGDHSGTNPYLTDGATAQAVAGSEAPAATTGPAVG